MSRTIIKYASLMVCFLFIACGSDEDTNDMMESNDTSMNVPTAPASANNSTEMMMAGQEMTSNDLMGDVDNGSTLYASRCAACHAADGTGGVGPDLTSASVDQQDDSMITNIIVNGSGGMPAFGDLSEQEVADIVAFIRSL